MAINEYLASHPHLKMQNSPSEEVHMIIGETPVIGFLIQWSALRVVSVTFRNRWCRVYRHRNSLGLIFLRSKSKLRHEHVEKIKFVFFFCSRKSDISNQRSRSRTYNICRRSQKIFMFQSKMENNRIGKWSFIRIFFYNRASTYFY